MIEPNFSESQLQQLVNTEISISRLQSHGDYYPAIVVSLTNEATLGWDSAFHLPWIPIPANPNHRGCNLFIQYKLADLLESERAGQFQFWETEYLRFQIPHESKNPNSGQYELDFHQFTALRALANQSYPVFYVSNSVVYEQQLLTLARARTLSDSCAWFDVTGIADEHRYLTYTPASNHGFLHSDPISVPKTSFAKFKQSIAENQEKTSWEQDIKHIQPQIVEFERLTEVPAEFRIEAAIDQYREQGAEQVLSYLTVRLLASRLHSYFGVHWHKF